MENWLIFHTFIDSQWPLHGREGQLSYAENLEWNHSLCCINVLMATFIIVIRTGMKNTHTHRICCFCWQCALICLFVAHTWIIRWGRKRQDKSSCRLNRMRAELSKKTWGRTHNEDNWGDAVQQHLWCHWNKPSWYCLNSFATKCTTCSTTNGYGRIRFD